MQLDFHYYATYCAACIAGYSHEDSLAIAYGSQFTDCCSKTLLDKIGGPPAAATTQLQSELMEVRTDMAGLINITRIWTAFHFLPGDLYAERAGCGRRYLDRYRLICRPDSELLTKTVELARGKGVEAAGIAMHILADTWAHQHFAGTPSLVINNTNSHFYEILGEEEDARERPVRFNHNPSSADDPKKGFYTNTFYQGNEHSVFNLGHGRAGHLPDYSFARYRYLPAWGDYKEVIKDNPSDYLHAFAQMVYALKSLREENGRFEPGHYDMEAILPWNDSILAIIKTRQLDASADWKRLGESISGHAIEDFDIRKYQTEYREADNAGRNDTFLGRYIQAALSQKDMVSRQIFASGNLLAGFPADYTLTGLDGIRDYLRRITGKRRRRE